jgi:hypothetical protein
MYPLAFTAGVLCKLYDDITDAGLDVAPVVKEVLKIAHAVLFCSVASADYNFAFLCYIVNLINAFLNPAAWTSAYERACLYVLWIPCLLAVIAGHGATPSNLWDVAIMAVLVAASAWDATRAEDDGCGNAVPPPPSLDAEISLTKLALRAAGALGLAAVMYWCPFSGYVKKSGAYILGYLLMSCAFQIWGMYTLFVRDGDKFAESMATTARLVLNVIGRKLDSNYQRMDGDFQRKMYEDPEAT